MKISTRLAAGFTLLIICTLASTAFSLYSLNNSRHDINEIVSLRLKKTELANDAGTALRNMLVQVRNMALFTDKTAIDSEWQRFQNSKTSYFGYRNALALLVRTEGSSEEIKLLSYVIENEKITFDVLEKAAEKGKQRQLEGLAAYLTEVVRPPQQILIGSLNSLTSVQKRHAQATAALNNKTVETSLKVSVMMAIALIVLGVLVCTYTVRVLMRQLGGEPAEAQMLASAIASGDLTTEIRLKAEDKSSLMASLSEMQENLRKMVGQIKVTSGSVALAADEISQGNNELSSRTEQQASALQETAASMEQISATVKNNSSSAELTAVTARKTAQLSTTGREEVILMSSSMNEISVSAGKIRNITSVIEGIAFQTNILALNAAVEAARAGEEGRGFAVVAGEVRTLAQRSATAAKEIKVLIDQATEQVENGVLVAQTTEQSISRITGMVSELAEAMDEISLASSEQMQGISQISIAVSEMDGVTQSNAALVEESSTASLSLSEQARTLSSMVAIFRV